MTSMLLVVLAGLCVMAVVIGAHWREAAVWRKSLLAFELRLPRGLGAETVSDWLAMVAASSRRWPICLEVVGDRTGIHHFLVVPLTIQQTTLSQLRAAIPGIRVTEDLNYLDTRPELRAASELRLSSATQPLAVERVETAVAALLSGLAGPFADGERLAVQYVLRGSRATAPKSEHLREDRRTLRLKQAGGNFLQATARAAASAPTTARAERLLSRVADALRIVEAPGVSLERRTLPAPLVAARFYARAWPFIGPWPLLLNLREAVIVGLPVGDLHIPGLMLGTCRQLPAPPGLATMGSIVGTSNYGGQESRPLALRPDDRLRHTHIIGPTGTGKSTLIANLALQDIAAGYGTVLIDPKADLVDDVLARIPEDRIDDVITFDAAALEQPIGFNILQAGSDEQSRELVVDHTVGLFADLWRSSWGPRTSDVLRSSILTLTNAAAPDGSAFTLCEIAELLTNPRFRRFVLSQSTVPMSVRSFWDEYDQRTEADRLQIVGPSMNKLRSLTTRSSLRLTLGQSKGLDLMQIFTDRKILLVSLAKGLLGKETAQLIGALVVAGLRQTVQRRAAIPADRRRPVFGYLDEFQDVVRMGGDDLAEMLEQARGLGFGLILAHQTLAQLPANVRAATLGTARSQIVFQLAADDARALEPRVRPALTAEDLTGLDVHEVALLPCVGGKTLGPVTAKTLALPGLLRDPAELADRSRQRYGAPRAEVEAALAARITLDSAGSSFGRRLREGDS